MVEIMKL